jgi:aldose 1-epimerase
MARTPTATPFSVQAGAAPQPQAPAGAPYVVLERDNFRKVVEGKNVDLFTIENRRGMVVRITNLGAKIQQILVPDRHGQLGDVVLGYETADGVIGGQPSMGAFVGRYANRIASGKFAVDGVLYELPVNDGNNRPTLLHGGRRGSRVRVFDASQRSPAAVEMSIVFEEKDDGFPGTVPLRVVYRLTDDNDLFIEYSATAADKKTIVNFTSHAFFNLSGNPARTVLDTDLELNSSTVLEIDANLIPTGVLRDVTGTPMDFRTAKALGAEIDADYDLLRVGGGYDHTYVVNDDNSELKPSGFEKFRFVGRLHEKTTGRIMEVWSTEPSVQVVTANGLSAQSPRDLGKGGVLFPFRSAFCIEPMHYPDSPNRPSFPRTELEPGETYSGTIVYRFYADAEDRRRRSDGQTRGATSC